MKTLDWEKLAFELLKQSKDAMTHASTTPNDEAKISYFAAGVAMSGISQAIKASLQEPEPGPASERPIYSRDEVYSAVKYGVQAPSLNVTLQHGIARNIMDRLPRKDPKE
jgi:hypothetical protein